MLSLAKRSKKNHRQQLHVENQNLIRKEVNMATENQPSAAMDSLLQALQVNIIPNQEYLLQGSILDSQVQRLLHR